MCQLLGHTYMARAIIPVSATDMRQALVFMACFWCCLYSFIPLCRKRLENAVQKWGAYNAQARIIHCNFNNISCQWKQYCDHRARAWLNPWHCNIICAICRPPWYHHASTSLGIWKQGLALECLSCITQSWLHPCSWTTWCWYWKKMTSIRRHCGTFCPLHCTMLHSSPEQHFKHLDMSLRGLQWCLQALPCLIWTITWDPDVSFPNTQSTGSIYWCVLGFQMTLFLHCLWIHGPKFNSITQETDEMLNSWKSQLVINLILWQHFIELLHSTHCKLWILICVNMEVPDLFLFFCSKTEQTTMFQKRWYFILLNVIASFFFLRWVKTLN